MEAKFTKGPWVKCKRNEDLKGSDGYSVVVWGDGLSNGARSHERDANAYLIAAAPDMYKLLQKFLPMDEDGNGWDFQYNEGSEELGEEVIKLLSKARGEL